MLGIVVAYLILVVLFSAFGRRLGRWGFGGPLVFVAAGALLSTVTELDVKTANATFVIELALVLILFHDAAQVRPAQIGREAGLVARLLLVGLPLTVLAGWVVARSLFPDTPASLLVLLAAALAATDAGLGAATVLNPVVPVRVRRLLNVESGLNDGLVTPVVLFALASAAGEEGLLVAPSVGAAVIDLGAGVVIGGVVGAAGGALLRWADAKGWAASLPVATLALPLLAYALADLTDVNGFVAAFVAGTAFAGARTAAGTDDALDLAEQASTLVGFAVWLVLGLAVAPLVADVAGWREAAFAVLMLTVVRMVPVALALIGSGMRAPSVLFIGWFGPRGLASVVFALLAVEELDPSPALRAIVVAIGATVLLSIVAHGLTAGPGAARYGAWAARVQPPVETVGAPEPSRRTRGHRLRGA